VFEAIFFLTSVVTIMVQCGYINQLYVREPYTLGPPDQIDPVPYTFKYGGGCTNVTVENKLMSHTFSCPIPTYLGHQITEFDYGCKGNIAGSHSQTEPLMALIVVATIVVATFTFIYPWCACGRGTTCLELVYVNRLFLLISNCILVGFAFTFYTYYRSYQAIEQCNPISPPNPQNPDDQNDLYHDGWIGGPNMDFYAAGCTCSVSSWQDVAWILSTVLPQCPFTYLDQGDVNHPVLYIYAVPSPLVLGKIENVKNNLWIMTLVVSGCAAASFVNWIFIGCMYIADCCCRPLLSKVESKTHATCNPPKIDQLELSHNVSQLMSIQYK
jgi:hypothetical protein